MAEYIERTEELILAVNAGARAIANTKRYHGTIYVKNVFSDHPMEMPYLKAAEILWGVEDIPAADVAPRAAYEQVTWERDIAMKQLEECGIPVGGKADVAPVVHGRWIRRGNETTCSRCRFIYYASRAEFNFCPNCGAHMKDGE